jgi:hypothetical protein
MRRVWLVRLGGDGAFGLASAQKGRLTIEFNTEQTDCAGTASE